MPPSTSSYIHICVFCSRAIVVNLWSKKRRIIIIEPFMFNVKNNSKSLSHVTISVQLYSTQWALLTCSKKKRILPNIFAFPLFTIQHFTYKLHVLHLLHLSGPFLIHEKYHIYHISSK